MNVHGEPWSPSWCAAPDSLLERAVRASWFVGHITLVAVTSLLLARRLAGSLPRPLAPGHLVGAVLLLLATTLAARGAGWRCLLLARSRWLPTAWFVVPTLGLLLLLGALAIPGTERRALATSLFLVILVESVVWCVGMGARNRHSLRHDRRRGPQPVAAAVVAAGIAAEEERIPERLVQRMTRLQDPQGGEEVHGVVRADFAPRQRTQVLHVAFCPPLALRPQVHVEQCAGPPATVRLAEAQAYGVRLEVRLAAESSAAIHVLVHLDALASHCGGAGEAREDGSPAAPSCPPVRSRHQGDA